ncbi:MAG: PocR ligand-binding domain-containing protein [Deltaproteobacteria bacterium]|nr:PocR ligand-binding domain-containing protein [Deltaproteobacteria bacterium]
MDLLDVTPLKTWESLENHIREHTGIIAAAFDAKGIRLIPPAAWPNRLCPEIKANPKGQSFICSTAHMNMANLARSSRKPVIDACDAGMLKLVVPIFAKEVFVGVVSACGMLLEGDAVDTFLVNKITGMEEAYLEKRATGIPTLSMEKAQTIIHFIQGQVEKIVEH